MSAVLDARQPCGTPAAYTRHTRRGEEPCEPCRAANAEASARRRAADKAAGRKPRVREAARVYQRARQRALADLARRYPDEYEALLRAHQADQKKETTP